MGISTWAGRTAHSDMASDSVRVSPDGSISGWVATLMHGKRIQTTVRAQLTASNGRDGDFFNSAVTPAFNCMMAMYDNRYDRANDDADSVLPAGGFTSFRYFGTFSTKRPAWLPASQPPKRWPEEREMSIWLAHFTSEQACIDYTQQARDESLCADTEPCGTLCVDIK